jgi:ABC-type transport system involved in multi-copper enzyme maturation permease subunit
MFDPDSFVLLADIFDRVRLQLPEGIVNWLTPVWILSLGGLAGLVLCAVLWGVFRLISLIPGVGTLWEQPSGRWIAIGVLTAAYFAAAVAFVPGIRPGAKRAAANADQPAAAAQAGVEAQGADAAAERRVSFVDWLWAFGGGLVACLLLAVATITLVSRRALAETGIAIREGVLFPLFVTCLVMAALSVLGLFVVRKPMDFLDSLVRLPVLTARGIETRVHDVPAPQGDFLEPPVVPINVSFRRGEIRELHVASDQRVKVCTDPFDKSSLVSVTLDVRPGEPRFYRRPTYGANPFREEVVTKLYVKNYGDATAHVSLTTVRTVAYPQMALVPILAVAMAAVFFIYLLQRAALPKMAAVALSTAKSEMAQPLFAILLAVGMFLIVVSVFVPYFTLGSDIKMLKDAGLNLILVICIFQAVWAASTSVAEEVEGKTALTVLSKPVSRRDFILGKVLGIGWSTGLLLVMLSLLFLVVIAYKPIYDYREGTYTMPEQMQTDPTWQNCHFEMVQVVPGLVLAFLETLVMAALSVAISTRLPALANFIISFSVYLLGHLTPLLVQSQVVADQLPPVIFFGRLIATVLPVLDHFNIQASVAAGAIVPPVYMIWALVYCVLYSTVAILLALVLFEDRDLA